MDVARTTTMIVEPDPGGHHFQATNSVAAVAARSGPVVLLTSVGATSQPSFDVYLGEAVASGTLVVHEVYSATRPRTTELAAVAATWCRSLTEVPVTTLVLMDADNLVKQWWLVAIWHFRGLRPRPRVVLMLTRYPARLELMDLTSWRLRGPKAILTALAMLTGTVDRASGFAGRDDTSNGWLVKRVRDPHYCLAHSRERARWRSELDLPADRHLVGIFGAISERKNAPLVLDAIMSAGLEADLVLAGGLDDDVRAWVAGLDADDRARVIVRDAFLSNEELDQHVAAVDVVPLPLTLNGPSGIMGKAAAAGVPVVTTGSKVRDREVRATGTGLSCEFTVESIGHAMRQVLDGTFRSPQQPAGTEATADEFGETILGVDARGRLPGRRGRRRTVKQLRA